MGGSGYPVNLSVAQDEGQNRLWGIPFIGLIIRAILVIPQAIVLWILAFVIGFVMFFSWIPILINGRQAEFVYTIIGYLRLATRVGGYVLLMTGRYPPFGPGGEHTIDLTFDETEQQNRLWGIPLVGLWVRWIILIPHFVVLFFIGIVFAFISLVTWIPVLVNGRTADWVVRWIGGFYRWFNRVYVRAAADRQVPAVPPRRLSRRQPRPRGPSGGAHHHRRRSVLEGWVASRSVSGASAPRDSATTTASSPGWRRKSELGLTNAWPPRLMESSVARWSVRRWRATSSIVIPQ